MILTRKAKIKIGHSPSLSLKLLMTADGKETDPIAGITLRLNRAIQIGVKRGISDLAQMKAEDQNANSLTRLRAKITLIKILKKTSATLCAPTGITKEK